MYALNINNTKTIDNLEMYMLNSVKNSCLEVVKDKIKELKKEKQFIPRSNIFINYNKLTASLAKDLNANFILRGLRNTTDFEFENSISQINKDLNSNLETVFLITSPKLAPISSTIIRDVIRYGGDINKYLWDYVMVNMYLLYLAHLVELQMPGMEF